MYENMYTQIMIVTFVNYCGLRTSRLVFHDGASIALLICGSLAEFCLLIQYFSVQLQVETSHAG